MCAMLSCAKLVLKILQLEPVACGGAEHGGQLLRLRLLRPALDVDLGADANTCQVTMILSCDRKTG